MRLASLAWRGLLARPLRTALAIAGVALGVAVVTATIIAGSSSQQALRSATADLLGNADLRLRAFADAGFQPRTLQALRALPEVNTAAPVSERRLLVSTVPGQDEQVFSLLVVGIDPEVDAQLRELRLIEGVSLSTNSPTDAFVPASWAARHGLGLGDELLLGGRREGMPPLRIVGLLPDSGFAALDGGDVLVMLRSTLDDAFEVPAPIRAIDLDLAVDDGDTAAAIERVTATLAEPFVIETADDAAARLASAQTSFVGLAFLFGLVALVVGAFLVGNTLAMMVGEWTRELGLLRAAGTTSRQVLGIVLRQALAIGLVGSVAGVLIGVVLAAAMIGFLSATRAVLVAGLPLPPMGLGAAFAVGLRGDPRRRAGSRDTRRGPQPARCPAPVAPRRPRSHRAASPGDHRRAGRGGSRRPGGGGRRRQCADRSAVARARPPDRRCRRGSVRPRAPGPGHRASLRMVLRRPGHARAGQSGARPRTDRPHGRSDDDRAGRDRGARHRCGVGSCRHGALGRLDPAGRQRHSHRTAARRRDLPADIRGDARAHGRQPRARARRPSGPPTAGRSRPRSRASIRTCSRTTAR